MNTSRSILPSLKYGFWLHWLTSQARYVRVCIPRRAMHASCDSPWHVLAKRCVLGACFPLTTPFRTRFSPCGMARIAHVQGLRGCLYTLRCFHIPTYRFHGTASACNNALASCKSAVSNPSVNQLYTGASKSWASWRVPCCCQSRARLVAVLNSKDLAC